MRIQTLIPGGSQTNAIVTASSLLTDALRSAGHDAQLAAGIAPLPSTHTPDAVVVPYNPFMWGRRGFAPRLVQHVTALRRSRPRPKVALVVHEPYVPIKDGRSLLMGAWQRAQLLALILLADVRFASIELWARQFNRIRPTHHLPSGSNLPDARAERQATRSGLDIADELVVATFSTGHQSYLTAYVEAALARLAKSRPRLVFLQMGAGAADVAVPEGVRTERPGFLAADRLGALVAASDILLTPFVDGVSTRRSSFMAGLCEEVAVLGTSGPLTDPMLTGRGLELVPIGDPIAYADRAEKLASDERRRSDAARAGRAQFEAEFTWEAIATRLLRQLSAA
jgi:glycosyltransferase involved in cell wall biosynthesis